MALLILFPTFGICHFHFTGSSIIKTTPVSRHPSIQPLDFHHCRDSEFWHVGCLRCRNLPSEEQYTKREERSEEKKFVDVSGTKDGCGRCFTNDKSSAIMITYQSY